MLFFIVPHLRALKDVRDVLTATGKLVLKSAVVAHDRALESISSSKDLDEQAARLAKKLQRQQAELKALRAKLDKLKDVTGDITAQAALAPLTAAIKTLGALVQATLLEAKSHRQQAAELDAAAAEARRAVGRVFDHLKSLA